VVLDLARTDTPCGKLELRVTRSREREQRAAQRDVSDDMRSDVAYKSLAKRRWHSHKRSSLSSVRSSRLRMDVSHLPAKARDVNGRPAT